MTTIFSQLPTTTVSLHCFETSQLASSILFDLWKFPIPVEATDKGRKWDTA